MPTKLTSKAKRARKRRSQKLSDKWLQANSPDSFHFTADGSAELVAGAEGESPRFTIKAYNGGPMRLRGFSYPVVVVLASAKFANEQTPILRDHEGNRPIGHTEQQQITANGIELSGRLSVPGPDRDSVVEASETGFQWKASIGARGFRTEIIRAGQSKQVNGRSVQGPMILAHGAQIYETSILAIGADSTTDVTVAAQDRDVAQLIAEGLPMTFSEWLQANGWTESELNESQLGTLRAAYSAEQSNGDSGSQNDGGEGNDGDGTDGGEDGLEASGEQTSTALVAADRETIVAERRRVREIDRICAEYSSPNFTQGDTSTPLSEHAITEGWSTERTELEAMRAERPSPAIHSRSRENNAEVIEASLVINSGTIQNDEWLVAQYGEQVANEAGESRNRYSLHRLMHDIIRAAGMSHPVGHNDNDFIRKSLEASQSLEASGFTTLSLPLITRNALNKQMLRSFQRPSSSIPLFMRRDTTSDFKPYYSYRLEGDGKFEQISGTGEIKHGGMIESEFTNQLETYARMLALTRKLLINDDMGALMRAGDLLAQMAWRAREIAAINLLMNPPQVSGTDFFHASRNNLITGAGSALGIAGLDEAESSWGQKVDSKNYPVVNEANRVLAGRNQRGVLSDLMTERFVVVDGTGSSSSRKPQNNRHAGMYEQHGTSPFLHNSTHITNSSTTAWFQFADPEALAAFAIGYLNGREEPFVEVVDAAPNQLGVNYRGYLDFGVAAEDPLGALRADGA